MARQIAVEIVEVYHCVEYMKYLLAAQSRSPCMWRVMLFLVGFGIAALAVATPLFKRTL
jgi:hypothetical protein